jgi:hypothetical protein
MQPPAAQGEFTPFALPPLREPTHALWLTNTQVNFCAKAYPAVAPNHPDAPALHVLGDFLRNGYLHRAIREQAPAGWQEDADGPRGAQVLNALFPLFNRDRTATKAMFEIIKNQQGYL